MTVASVVDFFRRTTIACLSQAAKKILATMANLLLVVNTSTVLTTLEGWATF